MHAAAHKLLYSHRRMALRVPAYAGLAWEGLLRAGKEYGAFGRRWSRGWLRRSPRPFATRGIPRLSEF